MYCVYYINVITYVLFLHWTIDYFTLGLPAVTIPVGKSERGLPLGVQLIARWLDEATMMKVARALEQTVTSDVS